jgi:predicted DNA-binding transcriptional regulator AlpA
MLGRLTRPHAAPNLFMQRKEPSVIEKDPLVLRKEAAVLLGGVNRATLYRWEQSGRLPPPVRLSSRVIGWRLSTLQGLLSRTTDVR